MSFTSSSREGYEFVPALRLVRDRVWQPLPVKLVPALRLHVVKHALWLLCSASGIRGIRPANVVESIHVCTRLSAAVADWPGAGGESALLDLCHAFDDRPVLTGGATDSDWPPLHVSVAPTEHADAVATATARVSVSSPRAPLERGPCRRVLLVPVFSELLSAPLHRLKLVPGAARRSVCTARPVPSPSPRAANHNFFLCTLTHQHAHVLLCLSSSRHSQRLQFFQHQLNYALKTAIAHLFRLINRQPLVKSGCQWQLRHTLPSQCRVVDWHTSQSC